MKKYMNTATTIFSTSALLLIQNYSFAADTIRLTKSPDTTDFNKPAILAYQRNDGGESEYVTQGAISYNFEYDDGIYVLSPSIVWNKNTLSKSEVDNRKFTLSNKYSWLFHEPKDNFNTDGVLFNYAIGSQKDKIKSSESITNKLEATLYTHHLEWYWDNAPSASIRPSAFVFYNDVSEAAVNQVSKITPTGIISGDGFKLTASINKDRLHFDYEGIYMDLNKSVRGDAPRSHTLNTLTLRYDFVDSPTTSEDVKDPFFLPSIQISRMIGDDPINNVPDTGYTYIGITLRY